MGIPLDQSNGTPSNTLPSNPRSSEPAFQNNEPATRSDAPRDVANLPPAALALASKLFDLAREGDTIALDQYLTAGIPPNLTNHEGNTLLMLAAYNGKADTVAKLIEKGADVNALNDKGQSPIAGSLFKGHDEVTEVLHRSGADVAAGQPNAKDCAMMFKKERWIEAFGATAADGPQPAT